MNKKASQEMPSRGTPGWVALILIGIMLVVGYVILEEEYDIPSWEMIITIFVGVIMIVGFQYFWIKHLKKEKGALK